MKTVYLDYAATTPIRPEAVKAMSQALESLWGNPSSQYTSARAVRKVIEQTRNDLARYFGLPARGFTFCSGATEANHTVILENARLRARNSGKKHVITSLVEHPAVLAAFQELEEEGFQVSYIPVNSAGVIELSALQNAISENTNLLSIMAVNNETGAVQPLEAVGELLGDRDIFWHSDIVQALGRTDFHWASLDLDAFTFSGHKIYGPKGIGCFYQKPSLPFRASIRGGHQEQNRRAGTENTVGIVGLQAAILGLEQEEGVLREQDAKSRAYLINALDSAGIPYELNGDVASSVPGIMSVYFPGHEATSLLIQLDRLGIYVSAGSACSAGSVTKSHVLLAMFGDNPRVKETIRVSLGKDTTQEDLDRFVQAIKEIIRP